MALARLGDFDWERAAGVVVDELSPYLGQAVRSIRLDTAYLPPMILVGSDVSSAVSSAPSGPALNIGAIMKPKLTVELAVGSPITYAPYGDPGEGSWLPLILGAGIALTIAYQLGKRRRGS